MMLILPIIGVMTKTVSTVYSRWILRTYRLLPTTGVVIGFFLSTCLMVALSPWLGSIDSHFLTPTRVGLFVVSVGLGLIANIYSLSGLKKDSLRNYELIEVIAPLFTMILAALIFQDEREPIRLALGLFASGVFALTHLKHHHLSFSRVDRWLLVAVLLFSLETLLVKPILNYLAPVTYYGLRAGLITVVAFVVFRPPLAVSGSAWSHSLVNTLIAGIRSIAVLYSVKILGIVTTQLVLLAEPVLVALISWIGFKEHWSFRQGLGFTVIVICIGLIHILAG